MILIIIFIVVIVITIFITLTTIQMLEKALETRDKVYENLAKYLELRNNILMLKENNVTEIKTLINLGSEFYVHAVVPKISTIFVNIGLGFHIEFTHEEALKYINQIEQQLNEQTKELTNKASKIKSKIKLILNGIQRLMELPDPEEPKRRDFL